MRTSRTWQNAAPAALQRGREGRRRPICPTPLACEGARDSRSRADDAPLPDPSRLRGGAGLALEGRRDHPAALADDLGEDAALGRGADQRPRPRPQLRQLLAFVGPRWRREPRPLPRAGRRRINCWQAGGRARAASPPLALRRRGRARAALAKAIAF